MQLFTLLSVFITLYNFACGSDFRTVCPKDNDIPPCYCDFASLAITCSDKDTRIEHIGNISKRISQAVGNRTQEFLEFAAVRVKIEEIKEDAFSDLLLQKVAIIGSGLKKIHVNAFRYTKHVTVYLDLQGNELKEDIFLTTANLDNLTYLNLAYNKIKIIPENAFRKVSGEFHSNLKLILLHFNYIHTIEDRAFLELPFLTILELQSNELARLSENTLRFSKSLIGTTEPLKIDLSDNNLSAGSFKDLSGLILPRNVTLNLSRNGFTHLDEKIFKPFLGVNGNEIDVGNNSLHCKCAARWLHQGRRMYKDRVQRHICRNDKLLWDYHPDEFRSCSD